MSSRAERWAAFWETIALVAAESERGDVWVGPLLIEDVERVTSALMAARREIERAKMRLADVGEPLATVGIEEQWTALNGLLELSQRNARGLTNSFAAFLAEHAK